jgi:hypothetical protein
MKNDVGFCHDMDAIVLMVGEEFDVAIPLIDHILHCTDDVKILPAVFFGHILVVVEKTTLPPLGFDLIDLAARRYTAEKSGILGTGRDHRNVRVGVLTDHLHVGQVFKKDMFDSHMSLFLILKIYKGNHPNLNTRIL